MFRKLAVRSDSKLSSPAMPIATLHLCCGVKRIFGWSSNPPTKQFSKYSLNRFSLVTWTVATFPPR